MSKELTEFDVRFAYEEGHEAATKFYQGLFEKAGMEDAAMMIRATIIARKDLLLKGIADA